MTGVSRTFGREGRRRFAVACAVAGGLLVYALATNPSGGGIPCIWRTLFDLECPGCGLTHAGALLLRGRFADAAAMNWLIFPLAIVLAQQCFKHLRDLTRYLGTNETRQRS